MKNVILCEYSSFLNNFKTYLFFLCFIVEYYSILHCFVSLLFPFPTPRCHLGKENITYLNLYILFLPVYRFVTY